MIQPAKKHDLPAKKRALRAKKRDPFWPGRVALRGRDCKQVVVAKIAVWLADHAE